MRAVLGIDRKIKRAWLDALLDHLTQTTDNDELRRFMDERLAEELPATLFTGQVGRHRPQDLEWNPRQQGATEGSCDRSPAHDLRTGTSLAPLGNDLSGLSLLS